MEDRQDAYGHQMYDFLKKIREVSEIVERDDGFFAVSTGAKYYFSEYRSWHDRERKAMRYVTGRVLDVGCGAGRVSLYLQKKGFDVLGLDVSPQAIRICKIRGLKNARVMPITKISSKLGKFDTVIMFGNNFGLFGSRKRAKWLLKRFHRMTTEHARIIAESLDPYNTNDPAHLHYHKLSRRRGRMGGQLRIRVRYREYATPWFDYLLVSKREMRDILKGTGWRLKRTLDSSRSPAYIAVIEKK
ncbi:MAG: class I SAM-dependent methyltransferase [Candidatus Bathyarchaeia archaeon]